MLPKIGINPRYYLNTVRKGIGDPLAAVHFGKRVLMNVPYSLKYESYRRSHDIPLQYDLVHEFVNREEFVLIILDSCRYDYFSEEYSDFFSGDLDKVWSAANRTPKWVPNLWDQDYDLTYISRMSWPTTKSAYRNRRITFDPFETFQQVIRVSGDGGTIHKTPTSTTDVALQHFKQTETIKTVVHYSQPHRPYIGDHKILPWKVDIGEVEQVLGKTRENGAPARLEGMDGPLFGEELVDLDVSPDEFDQMEKTRYEVQERIDDGLLSHEELQIAYRDNLRAVLQEVKRLTSYIDCPVVISADHGEHLGEHLDEIPMYLHPNRTHPVLREVPWFTVAADSKGSRDLDEVPNNPSLLTGANREPPEEEVLEHLRYMGYRT